MNRQADGGAPATEGNGERIGLVLAGGGARGACEAGALSVLLPALEARGERVSVIVGTSVGTLNAAWLAANVHRPVTGLVEAHKRLWRELRWEGRRVRSKMGRWANGGPKRFTRGCRDG